MSLCCKVTSALNGIVPELTVRERDEGIDVCINKKMTLVLAKFVDRHPLLEFYYLGIAHLALSLI